MPRLTGSEASGETGATRLDVVMTLAIVGAAMVFAAWDPIRRRVSAHPSEQACTALLNRYVEHVAWTVEPNPPPSAVEARKNQARQIAREKTKDAFARCESDLLLSEVDCAMQAPSTDAFERCLP